MLDTAGLTNGDLRLVLLVGVGEGTPTELRRAGAALARHTKGRLSVATSLAALTDDVGLRALVEGLVLGSFEFHWRSDGPQSQPVGKVVLAGLVDAEARTAAVARALAVAGAGWLARTLALVPSNVKNPAWLAEQAAEVGGPVGPEGPGLGREAARRGGLRRSRRGRPGLRRTRPAWCAWTTPRAAAGARRRTSSSSARASPSTPAACRSRPATT